MTRTVHRLTANEKTELKMQQIARDADKFTKIVDVNYAPGIQKALLKLPMLSIEEKMVYITLKMYAGFDTGEAHPGLDTISADASVSRNTVIRCIKSLSDPERFYGMPLIVVKERTDGGRHKSNTYILNSPVPILSKIIASARQNKADCGQNIADSRQNSEIPSDDKSNTKNSHSESITKKTVTPSTRNCYSESQANEETVTPSTRNCYSEQPEVNHRSLPVKEEVNQRRNTHKDVRVSSDQFLGIISKMTAIVQIKLNDAEQDTLRALCDRYGESKVSDKVSYMLSMNHIGNAWAVLKTALREDWNTAASQLFSSAQILDKPKKPSVYDDLDQLLM